MHLTIVGIICCVAVSVTAAPRTVTIRQWPQLANVLFTWNWATFEQYCGGVVINDETILTAAHCVITHPANRFRLRLGSTYINSGGINSNVASTLLHPYYNSKTEDFDVALLRTASSFVINDQITPANIAPFDYILDDHQALVSAGWGTDQYYSNRSEELGVEDIWSINQTDCERRYATENVVITDNMLCAGSFEASGRDQCQNDFGSPIFHNGVVVGIYSFSLHCGMRFFPAVNVRISRVSDWIIANSKTTADLP